MPIVENSMYRPQTDIVAEMIAQLLGVIPDAYTGDDGVTTIIFQIEAGQLENLYLAHQLLLEDMFIQTASYQALILHGDQFGLSPDIGDPSSGTLQFTGTGGVYIPVGSEVGYDPGDGLDVIYFLTTTDGTIPNPGNPPAPALVINATAGNLNGTYEYVVTYVTAAGESLPSPPSNPVSPVNQQINVLSIPTGGIGTTQRKLYRDKNGAQTYKLIGTITNNTVTTFTDNVTDAVAATGALAPTVDTAHAVIVSGQAEEPGTNGNVPTGVIGELTNAPTGLVDVTNTTPFAGGTEPEDTEDFRQRLLSYVQNPATGSVNDLQGWAEAVDGVDTATAFPNVPAAGSVTVRIAGPNGTVPGSDVIAAVQTALVAQDLANITIIVATFTAVPTNVSVTTTLAPGYVLTDVSQSVTDAITNYINGLDVGATLYVSGIVDAIFGLSGILDVVVTTPTSNQTTVATSKRTPGTITVS